MIASISANPVRRERPPESGWDWDAIRRDCYREARRVLGDSNDAEDAAQEALTRAWRQRGRCRNQHHPLAWARRIAHNEALRIAARGALRCEAPGDEDPAIDEPDQDALLGRVDVDRALGQLSPEDRLLVELHYVVDLQHARIARLLGVPEGTIKVRLHRIRKRLEPELA